MLIDGIWTKDWHPVQQSDEKGRFIRQTSSFRNWITANGDAGQTGASGFKAEAGRYHLYVALICPWASRTLMARALLGLEDFISVSVVEPALTDQGWKFGPYPGSNMDTVNGANFMHELYTRIDPNFTGRATVPLLWDKVTQTVVNNESADIIHMFNSAFGHLTSTQTNLRPADLEAAIKAKNTWLYETLNNGVYKCGLAVSQEAYSEALKGVFNSLDQLEADLADQEYLFGSRFTESDIRLFVTLVRFDAAYFGLFKTNIRAIANYPNLSAYLEKVYALPGINKTVNIDHIKQGYYSIRALNPNGIVPEGPTLDFIQ
ncbi:MAG: glutathione S-transferase C-terminal domain-containing protein [Kordiimonadaceae bacterium]|nr:glutathione S-transferase C-terminal domain-containing protein [Kordiimonadaceae bacterium]MBL4791331.1 glutathione S-transferase C-terminal domain-containing protein [Kordiimonadaceae bacterium]